MVAQPPFSTYAACCQESVFFNAVRSSAVAAPRWNWSTQLGAIAATTALLAAFQPKPMTIVARAPTATPWSAASKILLDTTRNFA
jgi:hypothetical protein